MIITLKHLNIWVLICLYNWSLWLCKRNMHNKRHPTKNVQYLFSQSHSKGVYDCQSVYQTISLWTLKHFYQESVHRLTRFNVKGVRLILDSALAGFFLAVGLMRFITAARACAYCVARVAIKPSSLDWLEQKSSHSWSLNAHLNTADPIICACVICRKVGRYIEELWVNNFEQKQACSCNFKVAAYVSGWFRNHRFISEWSASFGEVPDP